MSDIPPASRLLIIRGLTDTIARLRKKNGEEAAFALQFNINRRKAEIAKLPPLKIVGGTDHETETE